MNSVYRDKFYQIRKNISEFVGDGIIADKFILYDLYSYIYSCFNEPEADENSGAFKEYIEDVIKTLIDKIGLSNLHYERTWENFWSYNEKFHEVYEKYNLPYNMRLSDIGTLWLRIIDHMENLNNEDKARSFSKILDYIVWTNSFYYVFAYQYWDRNPMNIKMEESIVSKLNYYDYQELKTYVDKMEDKSIEEQINCLNRQYLINNFDYLYPDQETLWIDMIEKGISITESMKIVKHVSKGRGLETYMKDKLFNAGYDETKIKAMDACEYLKSRSHAVTKLLYTKDLLGGI